MTRVPEQFGFYGIISNPLRGHEYLAEILVQHGIFFIQLRMKGEPTDNIRRTAEKIRKITAGSKSLFIINDFPDIAREIDADGVHLGQDDMPYDKARAIVGNGKIVGLSTHNAGQTKEACKNKPSYIGIGPVFKTPTKKIPDPVIGLKGMREMLLAATVPAVAIGGINQENLKKVLDAGPKNFCSVRPLNESRDPEKVLKQLLKIYGRETGIV
jgi:thiamine-phosphate pyrophosphorylase